MPHGSVLGPLLSPIYINDIYKCSSLFKFYLFGDDTDILYVNENLRTLGCVVNAELSNLSNWLLANKLTLNTSKSNFVVFLPHRNVLSCRPQIKIFDGISSNLVFLECKIYVKYLGVLIDCHINWKHHIHLQLTILQLVFYLD